MSNNLKTTRKNPLRPVASIRDMILKTVHQGCRECRRTVSVDRDQVRLGEVQVKGKKQSRIIVPWACDCGKTGARNFPPGLLSKRELHTLSQAGNGAVKSARPPTVKRDRKKRHNGSGLLK